MNTTTDHWLPAATRGGLTSLVLEIMNCRARPKSSIKTRFEVTSVLPIAKFEGFTKKIIIILTVSTYNDKRNNLYIYLLSLWRNPIEWIDWMHKRICCESLKAVERLKAGFWLIWMTERLNSAKFLPNKDITQ